MNQRGKRLASGSYGYSSRRTSLALPRTGAARLMTMGVLLAILMCATRASAVTKRALIIGIDTYEPAGQPVPKLRFADTAGLSRFDLLQWPNLNGAVNDAEAMRALLTSPKFGFPSDPDHMHVLLQANATRAAVLAAMRKYLVDDPAPGDIVVFYYAGHGSLRYNSKSVKRQDHLDNTIVPADAYTGIYDIRDREIARIFNAALDKGVRLTAIFDSCHSGTIARGIPLGKAGTIRSLAYDPRDIDQGPDMRNGKPVPAPEDRAHNAALVFSAAQPDEVAHEWDYGTEAHGAFTVALIDALNSLPATASAKDVYERVKVVMEGMGFADQHPMLDGPLSRKDEPLFGTHLRETKMRVAVASVDASGTVVLDAGRASQLGPGSELVDVGAIGKPGNLRLRVEKVEGLTRSDARVISPAGASVQPGDLFELEKWVPLPSDLMKIWVPPSVPQAALNAAAKQFEAMARSAQVRFVADPAQQAATAMIWWDGAQWELSRAGSAKRFPLGRTPKASAIAHALAGVQARLYLNLPPSTELARQLQSQASPAVQIVQQPDAAFYILVGTADQGRMRYAWYRRSALEEAATNSASEASNGVCSAASPYPIRSGWVDLQKAGGEREGARRLSALASRLAKIHSWLELPAPQGSDADFPYHLALRRLADGTFLASGPARQGEEYDLYLKANEPVSPSVPPRWVYVLDIDCTGEGTLLFPFAGGENRFPNEASKGSEIALPMEGRHIVIGPPFGTDTFVLLTTDEELPDPSVLNFKGAAWRGARGAESPLEELLGAASSGARGVSLAVPTQWGVQYKAVRSVPAQASAASAAKP